MQKIDKKFHLINNRQQMFFFNKQIRSTIFACVFFFQFAHDQNVFFYTLFNNILFYQI